MDSTFQRVQVADASVAWRMDGKGEGFGSDSRRRCSTDRRRAGRFYQGRALRRTGMRASGPVRVSAGLCRSGVGLCRDEPVLTR